MKIEPRLPARRPVTARQHLVDIDRRAGDRVRLGGPYTELVWGPLVGPTAVLVARRLSLRRFQPGDGTINLHVLASNLGVGNRDDAQLVAPGNRIVVALARAQHYGLIEWDIEQTVIAVSGWAPAVPPRLLRRLPPEARRHHDQILDTLGTSRTEPLALGASCDHARVGAPMSPEESLHAAALREPLAIPKMEDPPAQSDPQPPGTVLAVQQLRREEGSDPFVVGGSTTGGCPSEPTTSLEDSALAAAVETAADLLIARLADCANVWTATTAEERIMDGLAGPSLVG